MGSCDFSWSLEEPVRGIYFTTDTGLKRCKLARVKISPGRGSMLWEGFAVCIYPDYSFNCAQEFIEEITDTLCIHRCYPDHPTFL